MKLTKIKILTAINGLLTLSSLIMLFFGLCNQVNESSQLLKDGQLIVDNGDNSIIIFIAVMALMIFGFAFFAGWLKTMGKTHTLCKYRV